MTKQDAITQLRGFINWFENNHGDEDFLTEQPDENDVIQEKWISYLELPEYLAACEALNALENNEVT